MEQRIKDILSTIDDAIDGFQESIPGIQKLVYDELQPILKELQIRNGKLLSNLDNLKLLGALKSKLEKVILNAKYKKSVENFIAAFTSVSNVQNEYFSHFNKEYKAKNTLPIIKQMAIEDTINGLVGQGMSSSIVDPIQKILNQNITTGGSYSDMQDQLRNHIIKNDTGEGSLERYTKQITTDALHQYNAQYHETIAQDLQFNWGRYVGSNIVTSRELCILLTKKQWVHKSELPNVIKGQIDGKQCKLSPTTGLPYGLIPGTNSENFKIRRGGYNCGHQFFWVPDSSVPADLLAKFKDRAATASPVKEEKKPTIGEVVAKKNKKVLDSIKKEGYEVDEKLFDMLTSEISFTKSRDQTAYFSEDKIVIGTFPGRAQSEYFKKTLIPHELGHAIHTTKGIIKLPKVAQEFKDHFAELRGLIKGKERSIQSALTEKRKTASNDEKEQICVIADILGSLSRGSYGYGHSKKYYQTPGFSEAEIFAHGITFLKAKNTFAGITEEMQAVVNKMLEYSKGL